MGTRMNASLSLHRARQATRSFLISTSIRALNWINDHVCYPDLHRALGPIDHVRWWLEDILETVFGWAFEGSDEEIAAVYNSEIPVWCMSARQRAVLTLPRSYYGAHCVHCCWEGLWSECPGDHCCPRCGEGIWLDSFNP